MVLPAITKTTTALRLGGRVYRDLSILARVAAIQGLAQWQTELDRQLVPSVPHGPVIAGSSAPGWPDVALAFVVDTVDRAPANSGQLARESKPNSAR